MPLDKEDKLMKRIKFIAWAVGILLSLWFAADNHFARANDLKNTQEDLRLQEMSSEESMLEIKIDINEERIEREEKKKAAEKDQSKIDRLKRKLKRYEIRLAVLEKIRLEKKAGGKKDGD